MHVSDPNGVNLWDGSDPGSAPVPRPGVGRLRAAVRRAGVQDIISPHEWSLASTSIADAYGFTSLPHLRDLAVRGPLEVTGVSETPGRARIFTCRPGGGRGGPAAAQARSWTGSARAAYRRPLTPGNHAALMDL